MQKNAKMLKNQGNQLIGDEGVSTKRLALIVMKVKRVKIENYPILEGK